MATTATEVRSDRWSVLKKFGLLENDAAGRFEPLLRVAANLCDTPLAALSFNDHTRERFIACHGCSLDWISRAKGFSDYILSGGCPLLVGDTRTDTRFRKAPLLDVLPDLRFYAGVPITDSGNTVLGTLAVMDYSTRHLPQAKLDALQKLGAQVMLMLEAQPGRSPGLKQEVAAANASHFESLFRSLPGYHYLVDPEEMRFIRMTEAALEKLGKPEEVLNRSVREVLERDDAESQACTRELVACIQRVAKTGQPSKLVAIPYSTRVADGKKSGDQRFWNVALAPIHDHDGKVSYVIGHSIDVTELVNLRKKEGHAAEKQKALEGQAAKLEQDILQRSQQIERLNEHLHMAQAMAECGSWELDLHGANSLWSEALFEILGIAPADRGACQDPILECVHPDDRELVERRRATAMDSGEQVEVVHRIVRPDGSLRHVRQYIRTVKDGKEKPQLLYGTMQDITHQMRVEDELQTRARQQEVVAKFGQRAMLGLGLEALLEEAVDVVTKTLDVEYCKILQLQSDGKAMKLVAGKGWRPGLIGSATVNIGRDSQAGYTMQQKHSVIVKDLRYDKRFNGPELLKEHGVVSGISVIIEGEDAPWGALGAHTTHRRNFTSDDVNFFESIANIIAEAARLQRVRSEMMRRSSRLEALLSIARAAASGAPRRDLQAMAVTIVRDALNADCAGLAEQLHDGRGMTIVAGEGWKEDIVGKEPVQIRENSQAGYVLRNDGPVIVEDLGSETRFAPSDILVEHGIRSGVSIAIRSEDGSLGMLGIHFRHHRKLDNGELAFIQDVAAILQQCVTSKPNPPEMRPGQPSL